MTRHRNVRGEMPFLDHLEELRWRIFYSLIAVFVGSVVGFALVYYLDLLNVLIAPVRESRADPSFQLVYHSPGAAFFVNLKLAILVGIILAFPVVVYQVWSFLSPALERHEKRVIVPALYMGLVLFVGGVLLAYYFALPAALAFFKLFEGEALQELLEVNATLSMITRLLLAFGILFELPVVIMLLSALGLVTPEFLREKRRHAIVVLTVLAAFLTPGDVINVTIMMMVPLVLLYELSIILSAGIARGRNKRELEQDVESALQPPEGTVGAGR